MCTGISTSAHFGLWGLKTSLSPLSSEPGDCEQVDHVIILTHEQARVRYRRAADFLACTNAAEAQSKRGETPPGEMLVLFGVKGWPVVERSFDFTWPAFLFSAPGFKYQKSLLFEDRNKLSSPLHRR